MKIVKAGALYFGLVFGVGFVLGTIRTLWVVPHLGARTAELMEAPIMLAVSIVAARWMAKRLSLSPTPAARPGAGFIALGFMLVAEFTLVLWLRGLTIGVYFATRDPVTGMVYYTAIGLFAVMPLVVARR